MTDFRWINWRSIGQIGDSPANGGFGWQDQYVVGAGLQYNFKERFNVPVTLRMGYNYGRSVVPSESAYANMLVPASIEHHLSGGVSVQITKTIGLSGSYTRGFKKAVVDNGTISGIAGSRMAASANFFSLQLNIACNRQ